MVQKYLGMDDSGGGAKKSVGWDIGAGSARTTGGASQAPAVSWDIGQGTARTSGPSPAVYNPTPVYQAPSQSSYAAPAPYIAPVQNYQPSPIGGGGGQSFAPAPPPPPPAPPVGGRQWYNNLGAAEQAQANKDWLGGDSDYNAQIAEFDRALQTFVDRIANQKKMFDEDALNATQSTTRNQGMSLDALGEDFGARGLSFSGMFDTEKNRTNERFNEAKGNIERVRSRNNQDADNREKDYRSENAISRGNAERSALSRQAQRQALIDSMAGF